MPTVTMSAVTAMARVLHHQPPLAELDLQWDELTRSPGAEWPGVWEMAECYPRSRWIRFKYDDDMWLGFLPDASLSCPTPPWDVEGCWGSELDDGNLIMSVDGVGDPWVHAYLDEQQRILDGRSASSARVTWIALRMPGLRVPLIGGRMFCYGDISWSARNRRLVEWADRNEPRL